MQTCTAPVPLPTTILALLEESVLALLLPFSRNPPAAFYQRPCISQHPLPTLESESPFQVLTNLVTFQFWHGFWLSRFGAQFSKTEWEVRDVGRDQSRTVLRSFARLGYHQPLLFDRLCGRAMGLLEKFNSQESPTHATVWFNRFRFKVAVHIVKQAVFFDALCMLKQMMQQMNTNDAVSVRGHGKHALGLFSCWHLSSTEQSNGREPTDRRCQAAKASSPRPFSPKRHRWFDRNCQLIVCRSRGCGQRSH